jgi:hypothetical protein
MEDQIPYPSCEFTFCPASIQSLRPTKPPTQKALEVLSPQLKKAEYETDQPPPSTSEVNLLPHDVLAPCLNTRITSFIKIIIIIIITL